MRRLLSLVLTLVLMLSTVSVTTALAADYPSLSPSAYCEFTASKDIAVYVDSGFGSRGTSSPYKRYNAYISRNDVCYIYQITSSYVLLNYPTNQGRRTGYIKTGDLLGSNTTPGSSFVANTKVTTLKYNGGDKSGFYEYGDKVYRISGVSYNVMYTAKSGKRSYKLAYVPGGTSSSGYKGSAKSLADVARAEIGYQGKNKSGTGAGDYTKYGIYTGTNGQQWCASFVSWCADKAGVSPDVICKTADCDKMESKSRSCYTWNRNSLEYLKKNDVIFFAPTKNLSDANHVGIVTAVNVQKKTITVIEGNTGPFYGPDIVKEITYTVDPANGKITKGYDGYSFCSYISVN